MERPIGVTILAVLEFLTAGACILIGLLLLVGGGMMGAMAGGSDASGMMNMLGALGAVAGVVVIVLSAIPLLVGIGLWKLKNWARILVIVFSCLGVLSNLIGLLGGLTAGEMFSVGSSVVGLGINVLIIWYMFQPHVKQAFAAA